MIRFAGLVGIFVCAMVSNAQALHSVTQCGETCSSGEQCRLGGDLVCSTTNGVILNGGADLDLYGHSITCSGCGATGTSGVFVGNNNSTIEDSQGGSFIAGPWEVGVDCQGTTGSIVRKVGVSGYGLWGINGCRKVEQAVVIGTGAVGIYNDSVGSSDYVRDSFVKGNTLGIVFHGSAAAQIDHNVVMGASSIQIENDSTSASSSVTGNVTYGTATPVYVYNTNSIRSGNVCGDPTVGSCATCVANENCSDAVPPFVGP